jgi:hypothetical protein
LKFDQPFEKCRQGEIMRYQETLAARLVSKIVLDILPAAAASLIGGLLFTHYGLGRLIEPAAQVAPASAEMMQLLRDEHGLMVAFLNAELAREKAKLAAEDAVQRGSGEAAAQAMTAAEATKTAASSQIATAGAAKPPLSRVRMVSAVPVSAPLVIAQVHPADSADAPSPASQSLVAKTMGLKDHVVSVTHRVVSVLGGIPSWIGQIHLSVIERPHPGADMVMVTAS